MVNLNDSRTVLIDTFKSYECPEAIVAKMYIFNPCTTINTLI